MSPKTPTFTPGPWEYLKSDGVVVTQQSDWGAHEIAWSDADHALIAAAPDHYAASRSTIERLADLPRYLRASGSKALAEIVAEELEKHRAAIAKAEGR